MKIQIHCEKVELSDSQELYLTEKIESLKKYYDKISSETVIVKIDIEKNETLDQKRKFIIRVTMSIASASFRAEVNAFNVEEGTDLLVDKLYRQIDRYKSKHLNHDNLSAAEISEMIASNDPSSSDLDYVISKRKLFSDLIPMSEKEAVATMKMLGHTFFIFVNEATDRYNVVYLRTDKTTYGLVELEHQEGVTT